MIHVSCHSCRSALGAILAAGGLKRRPLLRVIVQRYPVYSSAEYVHTYFYSTTPRFHRFATSTSDLVEQQYQDDEDATNDSDSNESLTRENSPRHATSLVDGENCALRENRLKALEAELPGIVDEILVFHEEMGTTRKHHSLRQEWEYAFRVEQQRAQNLAHSRSRNSRGDANTRSSNSWGTFSKRTEANRSPGKSSDLPSWDDPSASAPGSLSDIGGLKDQGLWENFDRSAESQTLGDIGQSASASDKDSLEELGPSTAGAPSLGPNPFENLGAEVGYGSLECYHGTKCLETNNGRAPSVNIPNDVIGSESSGSSSKATIDEQHKVCSVDTGTCKGLSRQEAGPGGESQVFDFNANTLRDDPLISGHIKLRETIASFADEVPSDRVNGSVKTNSLSLNSASTTSPAAQFSLSGYVSTLDSNQDHNQRATEQPSTYDAVARAIVLLRLLSNKEWRTFDSLSFEKNDKKEDDDEQVERLDESWMGEERKEKESKASSLSVGTAVADMPSEFNTVETGGDSSMRAKGEDDTAPSDSMKLITDLLKIATNEHLCTSEYNSVLARVAISPELLPDEILDLLMQLHFQMEGLAKVGFNECQPDATTYEILLLALNHRLPASGNAIGIVQGFMISNPACWTSHTVEAALLLFEKQNASKLALQLFENLNKEQLVNVDISNRACRSLICLMQFDNNREKAVEVLKVALQVSSTGNCLLSLT